MSEAIQTFLESYQSALAKNEPNALVLHYADNFMFADPNGVRVVERGAFAAVLPRRKDFFAAVGLQRTELGEVHEQQLSSGYYLARVAWIMYFEKAGKTTQSVNEATYILRAEDDHLRIVFQLDHQDLTQRVRELGLLADQNTAH